VDKERRLNSDFPSDGFAKMWIGEMAGLSYELSFGG
jgi:hypothetical protein